MKTFPSVQVYSWTSFSVYQKTMSTEVAQPSASNVLAIVSSSTDLKASELYKALSLDWKKKIRLTVHLNEQCLFYLQQIEALIGIGLVTAESEELSEKEQDEALDQIGRSLWWWQKSLSECYTLFSRNIRELEPFLQLNVPSLFREWMNRQIAWWNESFLSIYQRSTKLRNEWDLIA